MGQLCKVFDRGYYALNRDTEIKSVCFLCQSLLSVPGELNEQSTDGLAVSTGLTFACDIIPRYKQYIFIFTDTFASYTSTKLLLDEQHQSLHSALISTIYCFLKPKLMFG